jgi:hypothetical protein
VLSNTASSTHLKPIHIQPVSKVRKRNPQKTEKEKYQSSKSK